MVSIAIHLEKIKEHMDELRDAVAVGLDNKPITVGFHSSACAVELLELYLHKTNKIQTSALIKHEWFKRPKVDQKVLPLIERKLAVDFPNKAKILNMIYTIEELRNKLIYGKPIHSDTKIVFETFQELHSIFKELLEKEDIEID